MADSIHFTDGSVEYLFHKEGTPEFHAEFQRIMYEKCGTDVESIIAEICKEADYTAKKLETDLTAYESDLDSNRDCFQEILQCIVQMKDLLSAQRLNKSTLLQLINHIETQINHEI